MQHFCRKIDGRREISANKVSAMTIFCNPFSSVYLCQLQILRIFSFLLVSHQIPTHLGTSPLVPYAEKKPLHKTNLPNPVGSPAFSIVPIWPTVYIYIFNIHLSQASIILPTWAAAGTLWFIFMIWVIVKCLISLDIIKIYHQRLYGLLWYLYIQSD